MVKLENGKYVVDLPERHLYQDIDPSNGQPFASQAIAQAWEDVYLVQAAKSDDEAKAHAVAQEVLADKVRRRAEIAAQLAAIDEATTKPRTIREIQLGNQGAITWVTAQDAKAAILRAELASLGV